MMTTVALFAEEKTENETTTGIETEIVGQEVTVEADAVLEVRSAAWTDFRTMTHFSSRVRKVGTMEVCDRSGPGHLCRL